jgi:hypothetical protein
MQFVSLSSDLYVLHIFAVTNTVATFLLDNDSVFH